MDREFGKLVQSFFDASEGFGQACWVPRVDVYQGRNGWLVKVDLAGVRAEDVELRVQDRQLVVEGIRRDLSYLEGQRAYSMEISYSRFQRSVDLPVDLSQAEIRSEYRDGMLLILITPLSST